MGEDTRMVIEEIIKERTRKIKRGNRGDEQTWVTQKWTHIKIYNIFNGHYAALSVPHISLLLINLPNDHQTPNISQEQQP